MCNLYDSWKSRCTHVVYMIYKLKETVYLLFCLSDIRAVTSKLHSVKSNKAEQKLIHIIKGEEMISRMQGPEKMTLTQLGDYLCLGNSTKVPQNRNKLRKLMSLVPKPQTTSKPVTSGWSLLTEGNSLIKMLLWCHSWSQSKSSTGNLCWY